MPLAAERRFGQSQLQGRGIELQPPPLQLQPQLHAALQQQCQVGARAHAHLQHRQPLARAESLQLRGRQEGFARFSQGAAAAVEALAEAGAPEAEAAISALADREFRRRRVLVSVGFLRPSSHG